MTRASLETILYMRLENYAHQAINSEKFRIIAKKEQLRETKMYLKCILTIAILLFDVNAEKVKRPNIIIIVADDLVSNEP